MLMPTGTSQAWTLPPPSPAYLPPCLMTFLLSAQALEPPGAPQPLPLLSSPPPVTTQPLWSLLSHQEPRAQHKQLPPFLPTLENPVVKASPRPKLTLVISQTMFATTTSGSAITATQSGTVLPTGSQISGHMAPIWYFSNKIKKIKKIYRQLGVLAATWYDLNEGLMCWSRNNVRCILTNNWTFWLGIVSDHCAVSSDANDIMLTDGLVTRSSIILLIGWLIHSNGLRDYIPPLHHLHLIFVHTVKRYKGNVHI